MSEINLANTDAIKKLRDLGKSADMCMFTTSLTKLPLNSRPMSTVDIDDEGAIWFLSKKSSRKNREIQDDDRVQLFYANKGSAEFLSVYGTASIIIDKEKAKEIWTPIAKAWFPEGVDDPEVSIIKIVPEDCYYWDTKSNKLIYLLKAVASIATGKTLDDGVEGELVI